MGKPPSVSIAPKKSPKVPLQKSPGVGNFALALLSASPKSPVRLFSETVSLLLHLQVFISAVDLPCPSTCVFREVEGLPFTGFAARSGSFTLAFLTIISLLLTSVQDPPPKWVLFFCQLLRFAFAFLRSIFSPHPRGIIGNTIADGCSSS
jgi:hypothetical protein